MGEPKVFTLYNKAIKIFVFILLCYVGYVLVTALWPIFWQLAHTYAGL